MTPERVDTQGLTGALKDAVLQVCTTADEIAEQQISADAAAGAMARSNRARRQRAWREGIRWGASIAALVILAVCVWAFYRQFARPQDRKAEPMTITIPFNKPCIVGAELIYANVDPTTLNSLEQSLRASSAPADDDATLDAGDQDPPSPAVV